MKKYIKLTVGLLVLVAMLGLTACMGIIDHTMTIEEYFENNKHIYQNADKMAGSENGTIEYSVRGNSLVMTAKLFIEVDEEYLETYRDTLQQSIEDSDKEYTEVLKNVREDVPDATFIVEFVDKNNQLLATKEYK